MNTDVQSPTVSMLRSPRRLLLAAGGLLCVALAVAGVVLPGLPTTIFLIAASYCFTRSCPWLEQRLVRTRLFRPYLGYLDGSTPMPTRARVSALLMMWTAVAISVTVMRWPDAQAQVALGPDWLSWGVIAAAAVGTLAILRWRRAG